MHIITIEMVRKALFWACSFAKKAVNTSGINMRPLEHINWPGMPLIRLSLPGDHRVERSNAWVKPSTCPLEKIDLWQG